MKSLSRERERVSALTCQQGTLLGEGGGGVTAAVYIRVLTALPTWCATV